MRLAWAVLLAISAAACRARPPLERAAEGAPAPRLVREMAVPASPGSGEPNLAAAPDGRVFLSWIEPAGPERHRLAFATREPGGEWSAPRTVAEGSDWVVNWADFPSLAVLADDSVFAHWLARSGTDKYAYGVRVALSRDGGRTWSAPFVPHRDGTPTEHGFVSMVPWPDGGMGIVWLDGRATGGSADGQGGAMRLMASTVDAQGRLGAETLLDDSVCDCCQTAAARAGAGVLVAYRDRTAADVRDVSVLRLAGGRWNAPLTVGADRWQIHGCPVNGPALAARGSQAVVAWFAAPADEPRVSVAFSADAGATFAPALRVDEGRPAGRVDVVLLDDGSALVSWLESVGEAAQVRVRRVASDGGRGPSLVVAGSSSARSSGFPRMERAGAGEVVLAWRDASEPARVRTALLAP